MSGRFTKIRLTERLSARSKCGVYSWVFPMGTTFEGRVEGVWFETTVEGKPIGFNMRSTFVEELEAIERLADLA